MNSNVRFLSARALAWVVTVAVVAGLGVAPASAADDAAGKCEQSKAKGAGKHASCRANAYAGAIKKAVAVDGEKLTKCSDKVTSSFTKAEEKGAGACPTTGDSSAVEGIVDACIDDVVTALGGAPGAGGDNAKCQSAKAKEAGKYASCRLKAAAKGIKDDLAADYSKCEEKLSGKWAKLEEKPCATTGDLTAIKADLDACTTDVETAIDDIEDPVLEYAFDLEALDANSPTALSAAPNSWVVYVNVFNPGPSYAFGYSFGAAPNGFPVSAVVTGQGGAEQGNQQFSVYSDYNCCGGAGHQTNQLVETNIYKERTITAADVGRTFTFQFDAKQGNIELLSTANAFFKVLKQSDFSYATLASPTFNTTAVGTNWGTYSITLDITPAMQGELLQFGFSNTAQLYQGSGMFYDNLVVSSLTTP